MLYQKLKIDDTLQTTYHNTQKLFMLNDKKELAKSRNEWVLHSMHRVCIVKISKWRRCIKTSQIAG